MNILFISPNPIWGGAATANLAIAKMLKNAGHKVIYNDEYMSKNISGDIQIDHTPIHQMKFRNRKLLKKLIQRNSINAIIWSPLISFYFYPEILKFKKEGISQLTVVHSLSLTSDFKGKLVEKLVAHTIAKMSSIVYVSKYTMLSWNTYNVVRNSNANKYVIHNIVDQQNQTDKKINDLPRIGFVGRLSEEKQPDVFCSLSKFNNYRLVVYGDGPLKDDLIKNYPKVHFMGICDDVNEIYRNIDILVMTSRFENCPMVILESKARGIPCVVPNVGGIGEIVENYRDAILYDRFSPDDINIAISEIIVSYKKYSKTCFLNSSKFSSLQALRMWNDILS